jgi:hypothetical protein
MDQVGLDVERSASFTLTVEDYIHANRLNMIKAYQKPRTWLRLVVGIVLAIAIGAILHHRLPGNIALLVLLVAIMLILRLMFVYFVAVPAGCRKRFFENQSLRRPTVIRWSAERFELQRDDNRGARLAWKDMVDLAENDEVLVFYPAPRAMHIVPKRSLSESQVVDLLNCIAESSDL